MKVGDLVNLVSTDIIVRKNGIIIKVDMGIEMEPYSIPACLVWWSQNVIRWEFIDALEVITKQ